MDREFEVLVSGQGGVFVNFLKNGFEILFAVLVSGQTGL